MTHPEDSAHPSPDQRAPGADMPPRPPKSPLEVMARATSLLFLRGMAPRLTEAEAAAIAEEVGDVGLAVWLAGGYLSLAGDVSAADYLAALRGDQTLDHPGLREGAGEAGEPSAGAAGAARQVHRTALFTVRRLESVLANGQLAGALLARAAWMAPGEIVPIDFLFASADLPHGGAEGQAALSELEELRLIIQRDRFIALDPHVCQVVQLNGRYPGAALAVQRTLMSFAQAINEAGDPAAMGPLEGHLRWTARLARTQGSAEAATLCTQLGFHLAAKHDYQEALELYEQALALREAGLGPNHAGTAASLHNLGALLSDMRRFAEARPWLERALAVSETALGPDHPLTATRLHNLATTLTNMELYAEAQPLLLRALRIREAALGANHPQVAALCHALAVLAEETGDGAVAVALHERALRIR